PAIVAVAGIAVVPAVVMVVGIAVVPVMVRGVVVVVPVVVMPAGIVAVSVAGPVVVPVLDVASGRSAAALRPALPGRPGIPRHHHSGRQRGDHHPSHGKLLRLRHSRCMSRVVGPGPWLGGPGASFTRFMRERRCRRTVRRAFSKEWGECSWRERTTG